ncbi:MAG: DUF4271 domain-containing protein [Crocinitomicaceae bacterium]|nr:DUF4271 domain-containing protein [Crocinitomicaceae bacterium]
MKSIVQHSVTEIPNSLQFRADNYTLYVLLFILVSIVLIALAKLSNAKSFSILIESNSKGATLEQFLRENMRTGSLASITLLINYYTSIFILIFLVANKLYSFELKEAFLIAAITPLLLFIYEMTGVILVGLLTGEFKKIKSVLLVTITNNQLVGLLFFLIALFWTLNPMFGAIFFKLVITVLFIKLLVRSIKGFYIILNNGISLYYIILYFCTLEILPLVVFYYFFWIKWIR